MLLDNFLVVHNLGDTRVASPACRGVIVEADVNAVVGFNIGNFMRGVIGYEDERRLTIGYSCRV